MIGDFISLKDAQKELGISVSWLYKRTQKRQIKFYRIGSKIFFSKLDLLEYVKAGEVKTTSELTLDALNSLQTLKKQP